jgi:hypothetical protein
MSEYHRGDVVILLAYGGAHLTRRVWEDAGAGVLILPSDIAARRNA